jgi:hypothetical protein
MSDMLKSIKELLSFYWTPSKTPEDKVIKRYDLLILLCAIFIAIYVGHLFFSSQNTNVITKPVVVSVGKSTNHYNYNYNVTKNRVTTVNNTPDEFYIGETVCVKDFGVCGKVVQKILGTTGYTYEVRWKDYTHDLPKDIFYPWELEKSTLPISALQN